MPGQLWRKRPTPDTAATQTGAWTLDEQPAADGTRSVLAPGGGPAAADPIELLPTPEPTPAR